MSLFVFLATFSTTVSFVLMFYFFLSKCSASFFLILFQVTTTTHNSHPLAPKPLLFDFSLLPTSGTGLSGRLTYQHTAASSVSGKGEQVNEDQPPVPTRGLSVLPHVTLPPRAPSTSRPIHTTPHCSITWTLLSAGRLNHRGGSAPEGHTDGPALACPG